MPANARRAFTLVELITVVSIIAIVIAILVPALGGARNIAKKTATSALLNDVLNASLTFENDNRRPPGYFSPTQMGDADNADRGFTTMENVMLDLAGGVLGNNSMVSGALEVGPIDDPDQTIDVDPNLIGVEDSSNPGYFTPPGDRFTTGEDQNGNGQVAISSHLELPDLVDNFGQPILAWVRDPIAKARGVPANANAFAAENSETELAYFYWNANAGFLKSTELGEQLEDQTAGMLFRGDDTGGALGPGSERTAEDKRDALAALLGSPSFSTAGEGNSVLNANLNDIYPAASRGSVVMQSAGSDGVYLDIRDNGAKRVEGRLLYGLNIKPGNTAEPYTDSQGRETNIDIIDAFDDLVVSGGN